jgi:hypothetical protein
MEHDIALAVATLLDAGAQQPRLEQLARLTAARYWRQPNADGWSREATFMFRAASDWMYAVFPIYRHRYYAAVRIDKEDTKGNGAIRSDMFDVRGISVFEQDALQLACQELMDELA